MESREVVRILNKIERTYPVYTWDVNGIKIWPYIRFKLASTLFVKGKVFSNIHGIKYFIQKIFLKIKKFLKIFIYNLRNDNNLGNCDYLFIENGLNKVSIDGEIFHTRTDFLIDKFEDKHYKCKKFIIGGRPEKALYRKPNYIQNKLDFIFFISLVKKTLLGKKYKTKLLKYEDFHNNFLVRLGLSDYLCEEKIANDVFLMISYSYYFRKLLKKTKPRAVFIVCYYSIYGFALIEACKNLNIPIVDIQHGIQGDYHYAYGSWDGYNLLRKESLLPDIFYVWSKEEAIAIRKWINNQAYVFIGGNDYLNRWKESDGTVFEKEISTLKKQYSLGKYKKIILYTLGGHETYNQVIIDLIKESPMDWFWFVRMHPKKIDVASLWDKELRRFATKYEIKGIERLPLYSIMVVSDLHITKRSSTVMEAAELGVESIVLDSESKILYKEYIENKKATFFEEQKLKISDIQKFSSLENINLTRQEKSSTLDDLILMIKSIT